ncbi:MAG: di-trans,poly-cis-decaprenylcistransferase [Bifidobacteriaceae bacterium]|jgi:undecaprenyl diphosphate synthase|nr:di-trans,poly-cis-decaprenylcistransferase [Bifidobacteriaceae bacterium]
MKNICLHSDIKVPEINSYRLPSHVGIIMDGNGRWAKNKGFIRTEGHKAGEGVLIDFIAGAIELGIKAISFYAFSTENWSRPKTEVNFLMRFSRKIIHQRRDILNSWGVKIVWSGRKQKLWKSVYNEIQEAMEMTKNNQTILVNFCINYGGQLEIVDAVNNLINNGKKTITVKDISKNLYNPQIRPVDLIIRTSGEKRFSNFLLWDSAYAEFDYINKLWPDCTRQDLFSSIVSYSQRSRRFGREK